MPADDLPAWALDPRTPAWAIAPKFIDALNAIDVIEIQRGFTPKRAIDKRLAGRRRSARLAQQRPLSVPADRKLTKLKAHVSMWRNHIAKAEAHPPGSMDAARAVFTISSYRQHLAEAQASLRAYVESALREELHKQQEADGHDAS